MKRALLAGLALVAVGCSSAPAATPDTRQQYVIGFEPELAQGSSIYLLVTMPCSQQPSSWETVASFCDASAARVVQVDQAVWTLTDPGSPWPQTAAPAASVGGALP